MWEGVGGGSVYLCVFACVCVVYVVKMCLVSGCIYEGRYVCVLGVGCICVLYLLYVCGVYVFTVNVYLCVLGEYIWCVGVCLCVFVCVVCTFGVGCVHMQGFGCERSSHG